MFPAGKSVATRAASGDVLSALAPVLPELWGGSADLAGSNNTTMKGEPSFLPAKRSTSEFAGDEFGRTLHFGIREHAMGSILSGIRLHGLTRPYGGTFFTFSDYMRGAVRLASLMGVPTVYVWTHDSIGLGEDGPTHQPIEHLAAVRAIPGLTVVRPADANETAAAWKATLEHTDGPVALILTRQNVPTFPRGEDGFASADGLARGAYVLLEASSGTPDVILIATGSEVQLAVEARTTLEADGVATRVVSAPSLEWFEAQDNAYRESVLPSSVRARVSVEAGIALSWHKIVGDAGRSVSIEHYGASAVGGEAVRGVRLHRRARRRSRARVDRGGRQRPREHARTAARERHGRPAGLSPTGRAGPGSARAGARKKGIDTMAPSSTPLTRLADAGVAIWLDDLSRERLRTGNLAELVAERGVVGVTTNPSIFASALSKGDAYDEQLRELVGHRRRRRGLPDHDGRRPAGRRRPAARLRPDRRRRRSRLHRGGPAARQGHGRHDRLGEVPVGDGRPPERLHQDPRDRRGPAGHHGRARRGHQRQRDADLLPRPLPRRAERVRDRAREGT